MSLVRSGIRGQEQTDDLPPPCQAAVLLPVSLEVECGKGRRLGWGKKKKTKLFCLSSARKSAEVLSASKKSLLKSIGLQSQKQCKETEYPRLLPSLPEGAQVLPSIHAGPDSFMLTQCHPTILQTICAFCFIFLLSL